MELESFVADHDAPLSYQVHGSHRPLLRHHRLLTPVLVRNQSRDELVNEHKFAILKEEVEVVDEVVEHVFEHLMPQLERYFFDYSEVVEEPSFLAPEVVEEVLDLLME